MCENSCVLGWEMDPADSENLKDVSVLKVRKTGIIRFATCVLSIKSLSRYNRHRLTIHNLGMILQQRFIFYFRYWRLLVSSFSTLGCYFKNKHFRLLRAYFFTFKAYKNKDFLIIYHFIRSLPYTLSY
jgi:hypothetical protein